MVKTRAQRVANDENGVIQSPQQVLSTPIRKSKKGAAGKRLNDGIKNASRADQTSESDESSKQTKVKKSTQPKTSGAKSTVSESNISKSSGTKSAGSKTGAKKSRLREIQRFAHIDSSNKVVLPDDTSEESTRESEQPADRKGINKSSKRQSSEHEDEPNNKRRKGVSQTTQSIKNKTATGRNGEISGKVNVAEQSKPQTNAGLFDVFSRLTPRKPESQPSNTTAEKAAPKTNDTDEKDNSAPQQEQIRRTRPVKPKTKNQRILQEHRADKQKTTTKKSLQSAKRKRVEADDDSDDNLSDAPELKKKTARFSFKPDNEGNLALLPRDEIDPEDVTVIFVEGEEAARLISQEFERKKQVRFADRIAKQHSELTEEEKAAHQAELEAQNLQLTTQGFFGDSITRNGDMHALARKLDASNKTMLERIENLTSNNDEELRETLARDLMELAFAIRAAGPQSRSTSPVDVGRSQPWGSDKENNSASVSPQQAPALIEQHTASPPQSVGTPSRLFASIRKLRSYLPFGASTTTSVQDSSELPAEYLQSVSGSPTPVRRLGNTSSKSDNIGQVQKSVNNDSGVNKSNNLPSQSSEQQSASKKFNQISLSSSATIPQPESKLPQNTMTTEEQKHAATIRKADDMALEMQARWKAGGFNKLPRTPRTPGSLKRKIGSEAYPLTAEGKIPRPAPNAYGMNDEYFYGADSSSSSEEEELEDEPLPKRRRVIYTGNPAKSKLDATRLTKSAPRPAATRQPLQVPAPRVFRAPDPESSSSGESEEESSKPVESTKGSNIQPPSEQQEKVQAEKLKTAIDAHKPKTPSRLRQMATVPQSPIDTKARLQQFFKGQGTQGVLSAFAHI